MNSSVRSEQAIQQAVLWTRQGERACLERRFIKGIEYYQRALDLARLENLHYLQAMLCRDLAYIYLHHGNHRRALDLLEEGLALPLASPELHIGLLVNKVSTTLASHDFERGFEVLEEVMDFFDRHYPEPSSTPSALMVTYWSLHRLRMQLGRVVDLLRSGVNPKRIQVDYQLAAPPWAESR